ncbi:uncharacterized protein LOC116852317 [Odontomachus brunneus]|uniref:uncharacterized protein LOC116852317 n=1 Tax=Odontomachus brunneus TaxID=486640 RepID=UPI0013F26786|nr:uncharacterized protein LOC116852317 [Odontomachus brunneus]
MTTTIMLALCGFVIAVPLSAAPAIYDQRQTGDLNVQVELKNVHVVALLNSEMLDDYTDYDYFYDYADFTIKPSDRPISSSTAESTEKNDVTQITEPVSLPNSTVSASPVNSTNLIDEETPDVDPSNGTVNSTNDKSQSSEENGPGLIDMTSSSHIDYHKLTSSATSVTLKPVQALRSKKRCKSGYISTGSGRCRRANRRWLSLLPYVHATNE